MTIYLDYVFFINFLFDFILLLGINIIKKRNIKKLRLIIGSIFGGLTTFIVFIPLNSTVFFILKMTLGIIMLTITFKYKNIKYTFNNLVYLIVLSIILGGSLYLLNIELYYEHTGLIFFTKGQSINSIILILVSILLILIYCKIEKNHKKNIKNIYKVNIYIDNKILKLTGYLDTGNNLYDPYFNKPIIIINNNIKIKQEKYIYVLYKTISGNSIMKCIYVDKIFIEKIGYKYNVIMGISNDKIRLNDVDIILHKDLMEE